MPLYRSPLYVYAAGTLVGTWSTTGLAVTGDLSVTGNTTLGNATGDTVTIFPGTASLPTIIPSGDTNTGIWFPAADTIAISTAGVERFRIDSSGVVTIDNAITGLNSLLSQTVTATTSLSSPSITADVTLLCDGTTRLGPVGTTTEFTQINGASEIIANSSSAALKITQNGSGNSFVVEDSLSPDSSPFVINTDGKVLVGDDTARTGALSITPVVQINATTGTGTTVASNCYTATTTTCGTYQFNKSASGTLGTHTVVASGTALGAINFSGSDGTTFRPAAQIYSEVDGTPGASDMPGRLVFATTADGAASSTERMRIDSNGEVGIGASPTGASARLYIAGTQTGATTKYAQLIGTTFDTTVTANAFGSRTSLALSGTFSLSNLYHYAARTSTLSTATVSNQYGFIAESSIVGAASNYGFYGQLAAASGTWNFYAAGTANNAFAGNVRIGSTTAPTVALDVTGSLATSGSNTLGDTSLVDKTTVPDEFAIQVTTNILPTSRAALNLDFANTKVLDPRITFTRASTGTYIGNDGLVKTAAINAARFDHNPVTRQSKGFLVEESRTNLALRSSEFDTAAVWVPGTGGTGAAPTVTANYGTAPDGTLTADRIQCSLGGGTTTTDQSRYTQALTGLSNPHDSTISIWAKSNTALSQNVYFRNATGGGGSTIVVTTSWQRFSIPYAAYAATTDSIQIGARGTASDDVIDILVWGAQFEANIFATSYIPTTTVAVTRSADLAVMTGTNFSTWFNATEGTFTAKSLSLGDATASTKSPATLSVSDGTVSNYMVILGGFSSPTQRRFDIGVAGAPTAQPAFSSVTAATIHKYAAGYSSTSTNMALDGVLATLDTSSTLPTVSQLSIGSFISTTTYFNGTINSISYYPVRLSDTTLQALTT